MIWTKTQTWCIKHKIDHLWCELSNQSYSKYCLNRIRNALCGLCFCSNHWLWHLHAPFPITLATVYSGLKMHVNKCVLTFCFSQLHVKDCLKIPLFLKILNVSTNANCSACSLVHFLLIGIKLYNEKCTFQGFDILVSIYAVAQMFPFTIYYEGETTVTPIPIIWYSGSLRKML